MLSINKRHNIPVGIIYTDEQYQSLMKLVLVTTTVSMVSSLLVISSYLYLRIMHADKANRVSLHCVFLASSMDLINAIFCIVILLIVGDTVTCRASIIMMLFTRIMSTTLLTTVGCNLVLVLVFHVSYSARKLERIYFPLAVLYSLITIIIPVIEEVRDPHSSENFECYYYIHYYQLGFGNLLWMSYYGFLFFIVVIAFSCSTIALVKLLRENHMLIGKFIHIASTSQTAETANSNVQQRMKHQSNVFMRVVSRCVIYPLVPLMSNIWGFVFQIIVVDESTSAPKYELSLVDATFKCLQGFFVAIVFFSDPAVAQFIGEKWKSCKQKYLSNFSQVRKYSDGQIEIVSMNQTTRRSTHPIHNLSRASSSWIQHHSPIKIPLRARLHHIEDTCDINYPHHQAQDVENNSYSTVPMRRMSVPLSVYNSRLHHQQYTKNDSMHSTMISSDHSIAMSPMCPDESTSSTRRSSPAVAIDLIKEEEDSSNRSIFVPYKHPRMAIALHWILVHAGFKSDDKKRKSKEERTILSNNNIFNPNNNTTTSTIHDRDMIFFDDHCNDSIANSSHCSIPNIPPTIHPLATD